MHSSPGSAPDSLAASQSISSAVSSLASSSPPALLVQGLVFSYAAATGGQANWTLRVPSLSLGAGEAMLLQASSGAGKSTLLALIAGLIEPSQGTIAIAGTNMHGLRGSARDRFRGRAIGMVFQTHNLISGLSASENVLAAPLMAGLAVQASTARELLQQLGIARADANVEDLSVGQQQRVAIARALICKPSLVLADEPTASLDPANALAAMELLQRSCAAANAALLCVSHDPAMARRFSRVEPLMIDDAAATSAVAATGGAS